MQDKHKGSCMCGAVRFSFKDKPRFVSDCVCESCRRAHGAAVISWVGVKDDQFLLESGEDSLRWYRSSAEAERGFCSKCGTRVLFRSSKWPGEMHMTLASIHPPHQLKSTGIHCAEEYPDWLHLPLPARFSKG